MSQKGSTTRVARMAISHIPMTTLVLLMSLLQPIDLSGEYGVGGGGGVGKRMGTGTEVEGGSSGSGGWGGRGVLAFACEPRVRWWDPTANKCVPCGVCTEHQIILRPCQDYMDTVCGTMKELAASTSGDQRRSWNDQHLPDDNVNSMVWRARDHQWQEGNNGKVSTASRTNTEEIIWDWQVASLLLAIIGCLLFLLAAACVAINQNRKWRHIDKHFDTDMEILSAQLVNHLVNMQHLDSASILLENFETRRALCSNGLPIKVRCVYLDQLLEEECCRKARGQSATGNLYIEEAMDPVRSILHPHPSVQPPVTPISLTPPMPPASARRFY